MSKKKILIFPYNGNGIEALDCLDLNQYEFVGFVDDDVNKFSNQYPIFNRKIIEKHQDLYVLAVPGSPVSYSYRAKIINTLNLDPYRFISIIHPSAQLGRNVKIGFNCLVMPGVVITSNAQIGNHVCILPNSVVHHDVKIGDYTLVGSNVVIAGHSIIGENCYVGSGSNIINGIEIGDFTLIGLGSNVIKSIPINSRVFGNPASSR